MASETALLWTLKTVHVFNHKPSTFAHNTRCMRLKTSSFKLFLLLCTQAVCWHCSIWHKLCAVRTTLNWWHIHLAEYVTVSFQQFSCFVYQRTHGNVEKWITSNWMKILNEKLQTKQKGSANNWKKLYENWSNTTFVWENESNNWKRFYANWRKWKTTPSQMCRSTWINRNFSFYFNRIIYLIAEENMNFRYFFTQTVISSRMMELERWNWFRHLF